MQLDYERLLKSVMDAFNDELDYSFSTDNVVLRCFTSENGKTVYDVFISEFGFSGEQVTEEYFKASDPVCERNPNRLFR